MFPYITKLCFQIIIILNGLSWGNSSFPLLKLEIYDSPDFYFPHRALHFKIIFLSFLILFPIVHHKIVHFINDSFHRFLDSRRTPSHNPITIRAIQIRLEMVRWYVWNDYTQTLPSVLEFPPPASSLLYAPSMIPGDTM